MFSGCRAVSGASRHQRGESKTQPASLQPSLTWVENRRIPPCPTHARGASEALRADIPNPPGDALGGVAGWFPKKEDKAVALAAMKAVFAERDPQLVRAAYRQATARIAQIKPRAGELLEDAEADALAYLDFPYEHHVRLRTNNVQERANGEIKRRTKVVGVFPSVESMTRLVGSVLVDVNEEWLGMNFIDAASLAGVRRAAPDASPIPDDVVELARVRVMTAIEEKLGKAA